MKRKIKSIVLASLVIGVLQLLSASHAVTAEFMEGQFEPVMDIGNVTKIEAWEQPKTPYTPANLKSEYQIRYSGTDANGRGSYSYTTHFTDYDTTIKGSYLTQDGRYYITDTSGRSFTTGEHVDLEPINQNISQINNSINTMNNQVTNIRNQVDRNSQRIGNVEHRLKSGLATVSALTGLHPNPRSTEKVEFAVAGGMYADQAAGAIGLFYHPNNRVQLSIGAAYGGHDSWAGNVGVTFSLGGKRRK